MVYIGVDKILSVRNDKGMFSSIKLYTGLAFSAVAAIFLFLFKKRGKEIDRLEEVEKELNQQVELAEDKEEVSNDVAKFYLDEEKEIEEAYNAKKETIYTSVDKPLSPSLLSKLRSIQGIGTDTNYPPK